uniref:Transmembrane protein 127 transmembrane region domain-containing protein n=1 Tax=Anas platyrhynchos platyrhynchos TaxID=8840 RepID=A0A493T2K0_ANAPP
PSAPRAAHAPGRRRPTAPGCAVRMATALGIICTTAAYPSWVVVRRGSLHSVLGIICVLNQIEPSSNCHFVGRAGLAFMSLTALCYLLALLSSCGAMLLDILGLKLSRMTAPFLHGLVVLFTAIAVVSSCGLWVLTRHNLRTAQHPQLLGHSVVFGPSFYFCLLACALAVVATGCNNGPLLYLHSCINLRQPPSNRVSSICCSNNLLENVSVT